MDKVCRHLPSGNTCRIFRYDVVSRMIEALSNCDVIAHGNGSSLASSRNSAFSFSRRDRAAFLLFSFMAQRADKSDWSKGKRKSNIKLIYALVKFVLRIISLFNSARNFRHYQRKWKFLGNRTDFVNTEIELHWKHKK